MAYDHPLLHTLEIEILNTSFKTQLDQNRKGTKSNEMHNNGINL
jgi:hypothetical protein